MVTTARIPAGLYVPGQVLQEGNIASRLGRFPVISLDAVLPSGYLAPGAEIPGTLRNARFYDYWQLYDGEYSHIIDESQYPVEFDYDNWYKKGANLIRDFMLATPPEVGGEPLPKPLLTAIKLGLVHYLAYGTALLSVDADGDVMALDPRYYYEVRDTLAPQQRTPATVTPIAPDTVLVQEQRRARIFKVDPGGETDNWAYPRGKLGRQLGGEQRMAPRQVWPVAAGAADGIWGESKFLELTPAVISLVRVMSNYLSQQTISSQILVGQTGPAGAGGIHLPTDAPEGEPLRLAQRYGTVVQGFESLEFIGGDLDVNGYVSVLDRFEQRVYDIYGISPSLARRFDDNGLAVASGAALQQTYKRSSATFNEIIGEFLPVLQQVAAAMGLSGEVVWENPLAALRDDELAQQAERQEMLTAGRSA